MIVESNRIWSFGFASIGRGGDPDSLISMRIRSPRECRGLARPTLANEEFLATGTVRWFDAQRGFGFIAQDDGRKDALVHITAVERSAPAG